MSKSIKLIPFLLLTLSPTIAFADVSEFQVVSILQGLVSLLNADVARVIFILSIVGVGYGWLYLGRIPKGRAIGAMIGIGIVFSASWIAGQLGVGV